MKKRDGHGKLSKQEFKTREDALRMELLQCQSELMERDIAALILLNALDPDPANEVLNALFKWFDPRYLQPHAMHPRTDQELREPFLRRYWKRVPSDGRIAIFFGGTVLDAYTELIDERIDFDRFTRNLIHIRRMERQLLEEGIHLVKLWIGEAPEFDADDPVARLISETDASHTEWDVVDTPYGRNRRIECGEAVSASLARRLAEGPPRFDPAPLAPITTPARLPQLDLSQRMPEDEYDERKAEMQERLGELSAECASRKVASICVFEGWDAAGKGGAIRRLTQAMDARNYQVVPIAAPTPLEKRRPYLWRFWLKLPRPGSMTLFDRSWYGRVLVERVEQFAEPEEWRRAYGEINDFEEQLAEKGIALAKFWLHIDKDEQQARFEERAKIPHKRFKITEEDLRNRERWHDYERACEEMLARTSTPDAPWTLVAANDKRSARIRVLDGVCEALERALATT